MHKKILLAILILFVIISCKSTSEKFAVLEGDDISYGVYYNTNFTLYVPFSKSQLIRYSKYYIDNGIDYNTAILLQDLLSEENAAVGKYSGSFEDNDFIIETNDVKELTKIVKTDKVYFANTDSFLTFEGFDRNQLKIVLKDLVNQYKERIINYEM